MDQIALEIETLFRLPGDIREDFLDQRLQPPLGLTTPSVDGVEFPTLGRALVKYDSSSNLDVYGLGDVWRQAWSKGHPTTEAGHGSSSVSGEEEKEEDIDVLTVYGKDVSDVPTQYAVHGLKPHELPVIGTYVDKRIITGFKYLVRPLNCKRPVFNGRALTLERIGKGYGKRLTFESEFKNENDNYFWTDSIPEGYGFSPVAVESGMSLEVFYGNQLHLGTAVIEEVDPRQTELAMTVSKNGAVEKLVNVTFTCVIHFDRSPHGVLTLRADEVFELCGTATVHKRKGAKRARTVKIAEFMLPGYGPCAFHAEQGEFSCQQG